MSIQKGLPFQRTVPYATAMRRLGGDTRLAQRNRRLLCAALVGAGIGLSACADGTEPSAPVVASEASQPPVEPASNYRLANGGEAVVDDVGKRFPVEPKLVTGYADNASSNEKGLSISGWAAPADLSSAADVVIAFVGTKSVVVTTISLDRPDLVEGYDQPGLAKAGYAISIPKSNLDCSVPDGGLKTLAIVGEVAGPLKWLGDVPKVVAGVC